MDTHVTSSRPPARVSVDARIDTPAPVGDEGVAQTPPQTNSTSGDAIAWWLRRAGQYSNLQRDEEVALTARAQSGDEDARERLILANLRLVVTVAIRYRGLGVPFADLIQDGNMGLMHAVGKFDRSRGVRFTTYSVWWIRQSIIRGLNFNARTIRVPAYVINRLSKLDAATSSARRKLGREPTRSEIAEVLDTPAEQVERLLALPSDPISLAHDVSHASDDSVHLDATLPDTRIEVENGVPRVLLRMQLEAALHLLSPREEVVLRLRFGFDDGRSRTLQEVSDELGVTKQRIHQIEQQALQELRDRAITRRNAPSPQTEPLGSHP